MATDIDRRQQGLERVGRGLAGRQDAITAEMVNRIRREVPAYSRVDPEIFNRIQVLSSATAGAISTALIDRDPVKRGDIPNIREQAADRVRSGIDLESFLHAYRAALFFYWDMAIEEANRLRLSREVSHAVGRFVLDSIDTITTHAAEAYLREDNRIRTETGRAARELVDDLIAGRSPAPGRSRVAPGLSAGRPMQVIVARVTGSDMDLATALALGLEVLEDSLSRGTVQPLGAVHRQQVVVIAAGSPPISRLHSAVRCAHEQHGIELIISASDAPAGFTAIPAAYDEAVLTLSYAGPDRPVVTQAELRALQLLLLGSGDTTRQLIREKATALRSLPAEELETTIRTIAAFTAADMNVATAAASLHVHPNTVRNRLDRIARDTGLDPRTFRGLVDLHCMVELLPESGNPLSAGR